MLLNLMERERKKERLEIKEKEDIFTQQWKKVDIDWCGDDA